MIRVLPPEVVNQIAAGEVVERPFSVVKELVENSLDAGATRIDVALDDGGREAIVVVDDGAGFTPADLGLAFVSHATSKLAQLADLDHVASLGFRGEALASIGSVSRATIRSRRHDAGGGHEVHCDGGRTGDVRPAASPPGTRVEVRDLFHNTPARRRFLKTARAERARVQELLARLALARLDVDFTLRADGRELLRLPAGETLRERVGRAFGNALAEQLVDVELGQGSLRVEGLAGRPELARRDATLALLYVNGRLARDRSALQAVRQAYREHLMGAVQPVHFLLLAMPPDEVDVNVHPQKAEVRFLDGRRVSGLLFEATRAALRGSGAAPRAGAGAVGVGGDKPRAIVGLPPLPPDLFGRAERTSGGGSSPLPSGLRAVGAADRGPHTAAGVREAGAEPAPDALLGGLAGQPFVQALGCYLVFATPAGLVVVDQHALHERVTFERLRRRHDERGATLVQRLLTPEIVEVGAADKAWLLDQGEVLAAEGFVVEDFGGAAVAIQGIPAVLTRARPAALLRALLDGDAACGPVGEPDADARPRAREAVVERFHSMACRSSVMAGDRLDDAEVRALLREAARCEHAHNCPHGRPTVLTFTGAELERFFKRRV
ncbi:MAG: DNA mismatch repair endonuclease MutL [Planctomycetes bacterium]|nr:DNA mismatch repair endonuclease MutL [Planctomycetota bacterium]